MSDNVAITAGSGTTIAADDVGGVLTQRVKVQWGPDGTVNDADVATGKPLPIQVRTSTGTAATFGAGAADSGTVRVTLDSGQLSALGSAVSASSAPVVIASDQVAVAVKAASGVIASGAVASGAFASGALATGSIASGAIASGAVASGAIASGAYASGSIGSGAIASGAVASGAIASGAYATGALSNVLAYNVGAASATSPRVVLADMGSGEYETVAASQTAQALGATGATGDYISGVLVIPATVNPGNVLLLDNATSITVFAGGTASVSNLVPFFIPLGMYSVSGAWKLTTGTNVSCIGIGNFT